MFVQVALIPLIAYSNPHEKRFPLWGRVFYHALVVAFLLGKRLLIQLVSALVLNKAKWIQGMLWLYG
ncbi:unnamed protein product, partial [marine sediment metagenome]